MLDYTPILLGLCIAWLVGGYILSKIIGFEKVYVGIIYTMAYYLILPIGLFIITLYIMLWSLQLSIVVLELIVLIVG